MKNRIGLGICLSALMGCGGGGGGEDSAPKSQLAGQVDTSYGVAGRNSATRSGYFLGPTSIGRVAVTSDGAVYVADGLAIRRLDDRGQLDPAYSVSLRARSPLLDESGNLYVRTQDGIAKLDPAGRLATSFGSGGVALTPALASETGSFARDAAGNFVVYGRSASHAGVAVSKFDRDGRIVASFGNGGTANVPLVPGLPRQNDYDAIAVDAQGGIFLGGHAFSEATADVRSFVLKLDANGAIATGFGLEGYWYAPASCSTWAPQAITFDHDGSIYVGCDAYLFRLDASGAPDTAFGAMGAMTPLVGGGRVTTVLLEPGGELLVAGAQNSLPVGCTDFALVRVDRRGNLFPEFGNAGRAYVNVDGKEEFANIAMDGAGRVYMSGSSIGPCVITRPVAESTFSVIRWR
jgi:uncharacterized delta-60 repeat protein